MTRVMDRLVGSWELTSFHVEADDGRPRRFPFGVDAVGRVVYAADGHMMAVLSAAQPTQGDRAALETAHHASESEKARAFDRYLSYSGRWRVDGDRVHHDVDLALVPGLTGQTLTRRFQLAAGPPVGLTLSYSRTSRRGTTHRFVLVWHRSHV